jgi:hypothetical protein
MQVIAKIPRPAMSVNQSCGHARILLSDVQTERGRQKDGVKIIETGDFSDSIFLTLFSGEFDAGFEDHF